MPYIPPEDRSRLDVLIDQLALELKKNGEKHPAGFAGLLNYAVSRLVGKFVLLTPRYWTLALLTGVLENIKQELYRRVASPYEDKQIAENSDIPEYQEIARRLRHK